MLITFNCKVYRNVTMFGDVAKELLTIMDQSSMVPGAIKAEDVEQALTKLESKFQKRPQNTAQQDNDDEPDVTLYHRALPLISMLKEAKAHQCNVMWE